MLCEYCDERITHKDGCPNEFNEESQEHKNAKARFDDAVDEGYLNIIPFDGAKKIHWIAWRRGEQRRLSEEKYKADFFERATH